MRKKREFTDEEIKYIVDNWGVESIYKMRKKFDCSWNVISEIGIKYNLKIPTSRVWSEQDVSLLKELSSTHHYKEIAKIMNKTEASIYDKARRLNLTLIQDFVSWTDEEKEYLYVHWGDYSVEKIAKELNRTVKAVKECAKREELGRMTKSSIQKISLQLIGELLNTDIKKVKTTWVKLGLKLKKKNLSKKYYYYCIGIDDLLDFLKNNQDLWDSRNLEKNILGKEEGWLLEKRRKDVTTLKNKKGENWTKEEEEKAVYLLNKDFTYEEIAKYLNRSVGAVKRKIRELGHSYKLKMYWRGYEIRYLNQNYKKIPCKLIAEHLNKTERAVYNQARKQGLQKVMKK